MRERLNSIQALRFLAAAAVVYHHAAIQARAVTGSAGLLAPLDLPGVGAAGVDVFFVISGLVIALTGPLAEPRPTAAAFFWRRFSRVAPLFWVVSLPALMLFSIKGPVGSYGAGGAMNWPQTAATLFFWPAARREMVAPYLSQGWSLSLEMLFYSGVALFLIGGKLRRNALLLTVGFSAMVAARWSFGTLPLEFLANRMLIEFGLGVGLALSLSRLRQAPAHLGVVLAGVALGFYGFVALHPDPSLTDWQTTLGDTVTPRRLLLCGTPAVCTVAAALIFERSFRPGLLTRLGDASYSIYLVHLAVLTGLWWLWRQLGAPAIPPSVILLSSFGAAIGAGVMVHHWLERPLLAGLKRAPWLRKAVEADDAARDVVPAH